MLVDLHVHRAYSSWFTGCRATRNLMGDMHDADRDQKYESVRLIYSHRLACAHLDQTGMGSCGKLGI